MEQIYWLRQRQNAERSNCDGDISLGCSCDHHRGSKQLAHDSAASPTQTRTRCGVTRSRKGGVAIALDPDNEGISCGGPNCVQRSGWRVGRTPLIRHAGGNTSVPIGSLAKMVRLFSLRRLLVTAVCRLPLLSASLLGAGWTAVALATVAMAAYVKEDTAAEPPTETRPDSRLRCRGLRPLNCALHEMTIHQIADDQTDDCRLRRR
jgi:hypothetical protein